MTNASLSNAPPYAPEAFDVGATDDSIEKIERYFHELGDTYRVRAPSRRQETWVISNPDDIKRVLVNNHRNYTKGVGLDRVKILLGNGIMVSEGEFWRRQRLMIQPAFHRRVIERFANVVASTNTEYLQRWEQHADSGEPINITTAMSELTLMIVLHAVFGDDFNRMQDERGENPFFVVTREPARNLQFAFRFRSLTKYVREAIERRTKAPEIEHVDFLAMLMHARDEDDKAMSERELMDEVLTLVVAGHETTASALNWVWYLLALHPEADAKLFRELKDRGDLTDLRLTTLESLTYTQQVISEALRLYPPGWLITRRSIESDRLGGYELPAGTDVFLSPYVVHRHPAHWDSPEAFRPERFTPQAEEARHRYAFIPFVAGPRHCVGETFATYEMAMHLATAARRFRLKLHPPGAEHEPVELEAQINLRTRRDLHMRVERR
jgi:cytochrome P450